MKVGALQSLLLICSCLSQLCYIQGYLNFQAAFPRLSLDMAGSGQTEALKSEWKVKDPGEAKVLLRI